MESFKEAVKQFSSQLYLISMKSAAISTPHYIASEVKNFTLRKKAEGQSPLSTPKSAHNTDMFVLERTAKNSVIRICSLFTVKLWNDMKLQR